MYAVLQVIIFCTNVINDYQVCYLIPGCLHSSPVSFVLDIHLSSTFLTLQSLSGLRQLSICSSFSQSITIPMNMFHWPMHVINSLSPPLMLITQIVRNTISSVIVGFLHLRGLSIVVAMFNQLFSLDP